MRSLIYEKRNFVGSTWLWDGMRGVIMFIDKELLNDIFSADETGNKYLIISQNGNTWVLPSDKIKQALEMYQPYTKKAQKMKELVPSVKDVGFALRKMGIESVKVSLKEDVKKYIDELVGTENYYVAAYMGDVASDMSNKLTLQIFSIDKILCYIRVTNSDEAFERMKYEVDFIDFLEKKQVKNLPEIIDKNKIGDLRLFAQKSEKRLLERVKLEFDEKHMKCLNEMIDKTKVLCKYENTDLFAKIQDLKKIVKEKFPQNEKMIVQHSIKIIENKLNGTEGYYAVCHGDFSPWNIYYNSSKEVCMYDFEYACYTMPLYVDAFHYITKMSLYGMQNDGDKTIAVYDKYKKILSNYIEEDMDFIYLCYLVGIISSYSKNASSKFSIYAYKYLDWITIISYLNSRLD